MTENRSRHPFFLWDHIHEQPSAIEKTIQEEEGNIKRIVTKIADQNYKNILLVGSGTSYHASLAGAYALEYFAKIPTKVVEAFEFSNYMSPVDENTLIISVSRSGEKGDAVNASKVAKESGAYVIGLTNTPKSALTEVVDDVILTYAGKEYAGPRTKGYTTALADLYLLSIHLAKVRGFCSPEEFKKLRDQLNKVPETFKETIEKNEEKAKEIAKRYKDEENFIFIGGGPSYVTAIESALKMKETNYTRSEGLEISEFTHGPLAILEKGWPVIIISPFGKVYDKATSIAKRIKSMECNIIGVTSVKDKELVQIVDDAMHVYGEIDEFFSPIIYIAPLHLLTYYVALEKGVPNPDRPRNVEIMLKEIMYRGKEMPT